MRAAGSSAFSQTTTLLSSDALRRKEYVDKKLLELVAVMQGEGKMKAVQCTGSLSDTKKCRTFLQTGWRFCPQCGTRTGG